MHSFASSRLGDEEPDILKTRLYHSHLPNLAEKGYIEWDADSELIRRGPHFDHIEPLLDLLVEYREELPARFP